MIQAPNVPFASKSKPSPGQTLESYIHEHILPLGQEGSLFDLKMIEKVFKYGFRFCKYNICLFAHFSLRIILYTLHFGTSSAEKHMHKDFKGTKTTLSPVSCFVLSKND